MSNSISVTILTKNSRKHLAACLHALQPFSEIIVLDNGSTDDTLDIAAQFANVKAVRSPFIGFGPLKNLAAQHASNNWILSIDSDEVLTPELQQELLQLNLSDSKLAYTIQRHNYYRKKLIKACGWDNDFVLRLYHKAETSFADLQVHEFVRTEGLQVKRLNGIIRHYSYDSISQLITKSDKYTSLFAQENRFRKKSSPFKSLYKGAFSFFRNYILQRGILYGYEGLSISYTNAANSFYKYIKLHEANQTLDVSVVILPGAAQSDLGITLESIAGQQELPVEVVSFGSEEAHLYQPAAVAASTLQHYTLPANTELQHAIARTNGEYILVVKAGTALPPQFVRALKQKVRYRAFSVYPLAAGQDILAFWKDDLLRLPQIPAPATANGWQTITQALLQNGITQV
ncbi:glycosyltransferase family 2 protein [Pontibacter oryzae]|uniref:Glycosyltransferase family 2 protein n=1 Tax=Pontibacter oryzae TaxID=2304593 RepID=A0A399RYA2_9BACT|nr:glycosyltransferase family 2 protein [Pontibacter oryzae]RIJ36746.1 glycosyltransferase family 2 protein [Pontibacter oryzae]